MTLLRDEPAAAGARRGSRAPYLEILVSSALSLIASFVLSVEAISLAEDPNADLACNINAVLSCGTVGSSWQASLFGFPNAFIGLMTEPVMITVAVAMLAGVRFPRWFMTTVQVVYTLGLALAYWLFFQAMFVIGALCPWCLLITVSTTVVWVTLTRVNVEQGNLPLPPRVQASLRAAVDAKVDRMVTIVWMLVLVLLIVWKYGEALFA